MATLADNINGMAALVFDTKKRWRLTENTILRIIDMNLSMLQNAMPPEDPFPEDNAAPEPEYIKPHAIPRDDEELAEKLDIAITAEGTITPPKETE